MENVALVYVHGDEVKAAFMRSILEHAHGRVGAVKGMFSGALVANGRNRSVRWFLERSPRLEWLWLVDSDMEIGPGTLSSLLAYGEEPCVLSAATWGLGGPGGALMTWADCMSEEGKPGRMAKLPEHDCIPLVAAGTGCMLIHREVLSTLEVEHADDPWPWFGHDVVGDSRLGEDYTFCYRARAAGFRILGVNTPVKHHKLVPIDPL